jgi:hypothetical protein
LSHQETFSSPAGDEGPLSCGAEPTMLCLIYLEIRK